MIRNETAEGTTDAATSILLRLARSQKLLDQPGRELGREVGKREKERKGAEPYSCTDYDLDDSVLPVRDAVGTASEQTTATYRYTTNGEAASVQDANGNLTRYHQDGFDRLIETLYPDPNTPGIASTGDREQFGFDANGNPTTLASRNGQTVTQVYDALDRVTVRHFPDPALDLVYRYDLLGRRTHTGFADGHDAIASRYDDAVRLQSATNGGPTLNHVYDAVANRTGLTWPDGFAVETDCDVLNRPVARDRQPAPGQASRQLEPTPARCPN